MIKKIFFYFILFFVSCVPILNRSDGFYPESLQKVSQSVNGVVSAAHPLATKAGVAMLQKGGNAIDAAVASAFALAVVEPSMSGIGGRTQILIYSPQSGFHGIDATTAAPNDYDYDNAPKKRYGYPSIGIPGVVKGLSKALSEHGSLSREDVMKPAIQLAKEALGQNPNYFFQQFQEEQLWGEKLQNAGVELFKNPKLKHYETQKQHTTLISFCLRKRKC